MSILDILPEEIKTMSLLKENEKKYLYLLVLATIIFSAWFYLTLTTQERFALAHGYGGVSEAKELVGILGIAFAFVISLAHYQSKKSSGFLLLSIGIGLIFSRSVIHSTHMVNAMEPNTSLFESIFEGENHFLLSALDVFGAIFMGLGIAPFLKEKSRYYKLIASVAVISVGILAFILFEMGGDIMLILNSMTVSHGIELLPFLLALIPILAFLVLIMIARDAYNEKAKEFNRLLLLGSGLIFLRTLVHGVHTIFGVETHFFQSGFDLLGGGIIGLAYYHDINEKEDNSALIWTLAGLLLIFAIIYSTFTFFEFR
jgi:hypothetical protein